VVAFYLDNDVSARLGHLLRAEGHQVTLTRDLRYTRAPDEQQILTAIQLGASLITHNAGDFLLLQRAWVFWRARWQIAESHHGLLVLPQGPEHRIVQYVTALLQSGSPHRDVFYRYSPARGWTEIP
jgi:Domain of unknown function (DUF5615)